MKVMCIKDIKEYAPPYFNEMKKYIKGNLYNATFINSEQLKAYIAKVIDDDDNITTFLVKSYSDGIVILKKYDKYFLTPEQYRNLQIDKII